jgi:DNA-directed RNA polymerase subunit RPC12/RpoP
LASLRAGSLKSVTEQSPAEESVEIRCPHCKKSFTGSLLDGAAERYRGFKCPHCRLLVPAARVKE